MIRARVQRPKMGIDYAAIAKAGGIAKPESRRRVKGRKKRQFAKDRKAARAERYRLDGGRCVRCKKPLYLNPSDEGADWHNVANINEKRPRSLGGNPLDPKQQSTLCAGCHTGTGRHVA